MTTTLTNPDPIATAWGSVLKASRCASGLTQVQLAQRLGIHQTTVSQIERGLLVPSPQLQRVIANVCELDDGTLVRLVRGGDAA
jgi:DNA-binding XRE family transcriptional regulator